MKTTKDKKNDSAVKIIKERKLEGLFTPGELKELEEIDNTLNELDKSEEKAK